MRQELSNDSSGRTNPRANDPIARQQTKRTLRTGYAAWPEPVSTGGHRAKPWRMMRFVPGRPAKAASPMDQDHPIVTRRGGWFLPDASSPSRRRPASSDDG